MKLSVIGVPTHYGCDNNGTQNSPEILRNEKIIELIVNNGENKVIDLGNIDILGLEEVVDDIIKNVLRKI